MLYLLPIFAIIQVSSSKSLNPVINTFTELNLYLNTLHEDCPAFKSEHLDRFFSHYKNLIHKSGHGDVKITDKNQLHESLKKIIKHNNDPSKSKFYKIGLNQFSHFCRKQIVEKMSLKKTRTSIGEKESRSKKIKRSLNSDDKLRFENTSSTYNCHKKIDLTILKNSSYSKNLDWTDKSKNPLETVLVTPVKDQGDCGSCYVFAAAGVIEGQVCAKNIRNCPNWTGISEQYILDCGKSDEKLWMYSSDREYDRGCQGGESDEVLEFSRENGVYEYNDYPYELKNWDDLPTPTPSYDIWDDDEYSGTDLPMPTPTTSDWDPYSDYEGTLNSKESNNLNFDHSIYSDKTSKTADYCNNSKKKNLKKIGFDFSETCRTTPYNDDEIKYILLTKGPVAAKMLVPTDFSHYTSGIYTPFDYDCDCFGDVCFDLKDKHAGYHEITLVGYGYDENLDTNFWIVKNSWDTTWGENGYVKIEAGKNVCGIETEIFYIE